MKQLEEEFGPDRAIEIETDDEENEAERVCCVPGDDTESDFTGRHSQDSLDGHDPSSSFWPQSYRRSMYMCTSVTPQLVGSFLESSSILSFSDKKTQSLPATDRQSLFDPLVCSSTISDNKEDRPSSNIPPDWTCSLSELPQHQQCSYTQSILNAVNALCGIGILSTPYALKEGGWLSLPLLFVFGIITCYTGILLKRCLDSSSRLQTYPDIGQAAFGLTGRMFIAAILYMELYSSCVEFLIMMSDNLSAAYPHAQMDIAGIRLDSYQICAVISMLVILPTVWLRNPSLLSYVSLGGVMTLAVVVLCLLWVGLASDVGFHPSGRALNISNIPITIGIYSFCYGSHSVFPNIYSSMKEPSRFPSVLFISFIIAGSLYAGVAVFGFSIFGVATNPQFTLNLPENLISSDIAGWAVVANPLTKFALTITPVASCIEELLPAAYLRSHGMLILIRTILVVSTLIVALTVPYFGSVMALIGSFLVILVSVVLPCACYMRIHKERLTKVELMACSMIIAVGVVFAAVGTCSAVARMSGSV